MKKIGIIADTSGSVIAAVLTDLAAGPVGYSTTTAPAMDGGQVLVNPRKGRLTFSKKLMASRASQECTATAECVDATLRRFKILL